MTHAISIQKTIPTEQKQRAAELFDQAFGAKLAVAIADEEKRKSIFAESFFLDFAFTATSDHTLIGLAGFSTSEGSLTRGLTYKKLLSHLGFLKGNRAALILSFFERKARASELLMDGIVVDEKYRGQGIGSLLFDALFQFAQDQNYRTIRLDVIDTNPDAKRLYQKLGFVEEKAERFEFLRSTLGFGASTTMIYTL